MSRRRVINIPFYVACAAAVGLLLLTPVKVAFYESGLAWLYILLLSFLCTYMATPVAIGIARHLEVMDRPDEERKIHSDSTPLFGGLAVYFGFASAVVYNCNFSLELKGVALGATVVLALGVLDDAFGLSARLKLLVQIAAVTVMVLYGVVLTIVPTMWPGSDVLNIALTYLWIVGIVNALNFMDGIDGLATGLAAIASVYIGATAIFTVQVYLMYLAVALLGSCLGFLPYNFRMRGPARIFLGDAGSTFLGFSLAAMAVMGGWGSYYPIKAFILPTLILGVLIYDIVYISISRVLRGDVRTVGEWISYVGKDHLHHRLLNLGLGTKQTVLFIYFVSGALGLSTLVIRQGSSAEALLILGQAAMIFLIISILMVKGAEAASVGQGQLGGSGNRSGDLHGGLSGGEPECTGSRGVV